MIDGSDSAQAGWGEAREKLGALNSGGAFGIGWKYNCSHRPARTFAKKKKYKSRHEKAR